VKDRAVGSGAGRVLGKYPVKLPAGAGLRTKTNLLNNAILMPLG
jgi:hypothetical protein